jgi:hypothetical protein
VKEEEEEPHTIPIAEVLSPLPETLEGARQ